MFNVETDEFCLLSKHESTRNNSSSSSNLHSLSVYSSLRIAFTRATYVCPILSPSVLARDGHRGASKSSSRRRRRVYSIFQKETDLEHTQRFFAYLCRPRGRFGCYVNGTSVGKTLCCRYCCNLSVSSRDGSFFCGASRCALFLLWFICVCNVSQFTWRRVRWLLQMESCKLFYIVKLFIIAIFVTKALSVLN